MCVPGGSVRLDPLFAEDVTTGYWCGWTDDFAEYPPCDVWELRLWLAV